MKKKLLYTLVATVATLPSLMAEGGLSSTPPSADKMMESRSEVQQAEHVHLKWQDMFPGVKASDVAGDVSIIDSVLYQVGLPNWGGSIQITNGHTLSSLNPEQLQKLADSIYDQFPGQIVFSAQDQEGAVQKINIQSVKLNIEADYSQMDLIRGILEDENHKKIETISFPIANWNTLKDFIDYYRVGMEQAAILLQEMKSSENQSDDEKKAIESAQNEINVSAAQIANFSKSWDLINRLQKDGIDTTVKQEAVKLITGMSTYVSRFMPSLPFLTPNPDNPLKQTNKLVEHQPITLKLKALKALPKFDSAKQLINNSMEAPPSYEEVTSGKHSNEI